MLNLLRKLGILRYGSKSATYTSGKDMPAEHLMDGVFNADKDLVNKEDLDKIRTAVTRTGGNKDGAD